MNPKGNKKTTIMNNEDFVTYEIAQALKKAGFDYPCYYYYTKEDTPNECVWHTTSEEAPIDYNRSVYAGCSMPTLAQAQKWLREVKGIAINVYAHDGGFYTWDETYLPNAPEYKGAIPVDWLRYVSYESALSAGIEAALKLIEEGVV